MRTLDPRDPLVLDTRDLGRRPGSQRELSRTVAAPADLGIDMLGVPVGSDLILELRLESVMEGVLVSGIASVTLAGQCVRCLEPIGDRLDVQLQELFAYDESDAEDDEARRLEGDALDLEPLLRDAVVLALPHNPLCGPDCPGLCSDCGARLADDPDHTHGEAIDPRWAALSQLSDQATLPGAMSGADEE